MEQRYHQHHQQHRSERAKHHLSHAYHYPQQLPLPPPPQSYVHHHHHHQQLMSLSRGGGRTDYYHSSRHVDYVDVDQPPPPPRRAVKHAYEQPKDAESLEQDLRSRLLSKRHKYVKDYESEENYEQLQPSHSRRKDRESRRGSHSHKLRHGQVIELLDSPETAAATQHHRSKQQKRAEAEEALNPVLQRRTANSDPELLARREKILAAERENRQRKQIAREELEARREQLLRERNEHSDALSPSAVAASVTAGLHIVKRKQKVKMEDVHYERRKRIKQTAEEVKRQTKQNDEGSEESEESDSEEEEEDDEEDSGSAESDSDTADSAESSYAQEPHKKNKRKRKLPDDDEDVPLPDSPLSVGALYKSPKQRARSRSASSKSSERSHSSAASSNSNSRHSSRSRSSRSRSRSPASSLGERQRSRSSSTRSEERGMAQQQQQQLLDNIEASITEKPPKAPVEELPPCDDKGVPLPNYYPGVQGCRSVEEFQCLNRIEEGTYGVVYRAKDKRTNEIVALKRLKMEKEKEGFPITSLREINTLLKGQHPNIVTVREIVVGSNMDKIFIVMDYVEHDLKSLMETMKQRKQSFFPGEVKCLVQQLLLAVAHLHDNWILHRDLKTSNLLLSHKGILKVGDFGLAREYGSPLKKYTSLVVTLWYRAPELLLCSPEYSTPIDVWSVGCIFAEFLQMAPLFPGKSEIDELNRIFKELGTPNEKIWPGYSELPAVKNMLSQNSQFTDYPVSQLRKHFQDKTSDAGLGLLQGLLTYDPKQRLTADAALKHGYFKELPLPIDPSMFPTWPAKSELGARKAQASSPKPPSGGSQFKQLGRDEPMPTAAVGGGGAKLASGIITGNKKSGATAASTGFVLNAGLTQRQLAMGPGFSLKF
ncbi:serine/threonine-protein kinase PITSLRE isoform X2 [Drosophila virilis]